MHLANMDRLQVGIGKNLPHSINRYALISTILSMCKKHTIPVYIHNYPLEDTPFSPDKLDLVIVSEGGVIKRTGNHKPIFIAITHNKVINNVAPYVIISSHELSSIVRAHTDTEYELYRNPDAVLNNDLMSAIISAHKICVKNREDKNAPTIVKIIGGIIIDFTMIFLIKMVMERICEEK